MSYLHCARTTTTIVRLFVSIRFIFMRRAPFPVVVTGAPRNVLRGPPTVAHCREIGHFGRLDTRDDTSVTFVIKTPDGELVALCDVVHCATRLFFSSSSSLVFVCGSFARRGAKTGRAFSSRPVGSTRPAAASVVRTGYRSKRRVRMRTVTDVPPRPACDYRKTIKVDA